MFFIESILLYLKTRIYIDKKTKGESWCKYKIHNHIPDNIRGYNEATYRQLCLLLMGPNFFQDMMEDGYIENYNLIPDTNVLKAKEANRANFNLVDVLYDKCKCWPADTTPKVSRPVVQSDQVINPDNYLDHLEKLDPEGKLAAFIANVNMSVNLVKARPKSKADTTTAPKNKSKKKKKKAKGNTQYGSLSVINDIQDISDITISSTLYESRGANETFSDTDRSKTSSPIIVDKNTATTAGPSHTTDIRLFNAELGVEGVPYKKR